MSRTPASRRIENALVTRLEPQHITLFEVGDAVGGRARRFADAIGVYNWTTPSPHFVGFEIKISRGDWLRELRDPSKADAFLPYCKTWCLAAMPGVANKEELPPSWGLLELHGEKLVTKVRPPVLAPQSPPWPLIQMLIRRAHERRDGEVMSEASKMIARLRADIDRRVEDQVRHAIQQSDGIKHRAAAIKEETGLDLLHGYYNPKSIRHALGLIDALGRMDSARRSAEALIKAIDGLIGGAR
ncbi:MAG: hypothetical protein ACRCTI_11210 [Beijerinckiaceae bacterium]